MDKNSAIIAAMAPANRSPFTPVQVQKLMFLLDKEMSDEIGGPLFNFEPYHYGPFDKSIYTRLRKLSQGGDVEIVTVEGQNWVNFRLTEPGQEKGDKELELLDSWVRKAIGTYSEWVRGLSFSQLVSSIYKQYPDTKANSVFNR